MDQPAVPYQQAIKVFVSYSHQDTRLRDELTKHLALMESDGAITAWHDHQMTAGTEWADEIDSHLKTAQIILLLISADFIASQYCYGVEMPQAMERHNRGDAQVIPIILKPVDWHSAPFGKLQALPKKGEPVTTWANQDEAFSDVACGIRSVVEKLAQKHQDSTRLKRSGVRNQLPAPVEIIPSRQKFVDKLVDRMKQPGCLAITGPWGIGATTVAIQAAHSTAERKAFQRLLWVDCRDRSLPEICVQLCADAGINMDENVRLDTYVQQRLGEEKNLILFDTPPLEIGACLPSGKATCVIVTSDKGVVRHLSIGPEDCFEVPRLSLDERRNLFAFWLPQQQQQEPEAFEILVGLLDGWPLALQAVQQAVLNDFVSPTPIARLVEDLQTNGLPGVTQIFLNRLLEIDHETLIILSSLPGSGFSTFAAAAALGRTSEEILGNLNRLVGMSLLKSIGGARWQLEAEPRQFLNANPHFALQRHQARERLISHFTEKLTASPTHVGELVLDYKLVLDLMTPSAQEARGANRSLIKGISELAKRVGEWGRLSELWSHLTHISIDTSKHDRAYYLSKSGQAATRDGSIQRGAELLQQAIETLGNQDVGLRSRILTSQGSNFAQQGKHGMAVDALEQALVLEQQHFKGQRGEYIVKHSLAKSLWYLKRKNEAERFIRESLTLAAACQEGVTGRPQESHAAIGNSILSGIPIGSTCSRYGYNRSVSFSMR